MHISTRLIPAATGLLVLLACQPPQEVWFTERPESAVQVGEPFTITVRAQPTARNDDFRFSFFDGEGEGFRIDDAAFVEEQDQLDLDTEDHAVSVLATGRVGSFPREGVFIDLTLVCEEAGDLDLWLMVGLNDQDQARVDCVEAE